MNKRIIVIILLTFLLFSGCTTRNNYVFMQSLENVQSIEIIYVSPYQSYNHKDYLELEPIASVEKSNWDNFKKEFDKMSCKAYFLDPPLSISKNVIRMTYVDGAVELICASSGLYYTDEEEKYQNIYFDQTEFDNFVEAVVSMAQC